MNQLATVGGTALMPQMTIEDAVERYNLMTAFVASVMKEQTDYGKIPGTPKPTLLKPGAEKLCSLFGLSTRFVVSEKVEDWTGKDHNGEAFFYYSYRCQLWYGDRMIAESDGSCNSWEKKYRYRNAERVCPHCGQPTIIKGKAEYGGGYICFAKKGGCGAKFSDNDPSITEQEVGKVPNPDVADLVNTVQKMAQKRAFVGSTLIACNASEYFTQDVEDMDIIDVAPRFARVVEVVQEPLQTAPDLKKESITADQMKQLHTLGRELYADKWDTERPRLVHWVTRKRTESSKELTVIEADTLIYGFEGKLAERQAKKEEESYEVPELNPVEYAAETAKCIECNAAPATVGDYCSTCAERKTIADELTARREAKRQKQPA